MSTAQSTNAGQPSADPSGIFNPTPHVHAAGFLPRQEPLYDAANVYANNQLIALYNAASPSKFIGAPESVTAPASAGSVAAMASSKAKATSQAEQEAGLAGEGEAAAEGPGGAPISKVSADPTAGVTTDTGTGISQLDPNSDPTQIFVILGKILNGVLAEAASGGWHEGNNPKVIACFAAVGFNIKDDVNTPWCAAFAGAMLKKAGVNSLKTLSSLAYKGFGTAVDVNDKGKWRLNDILVFSRAGGGHIGFFRGFNQANGSILVCGGNQSDNVTETAFKAGGMPVVYVGRAWSVPEEYDKQVAYSGSGPKTVKVV